MKFTVPIDPNTRAKINLRCELFLDGTHIRVKLQFKRWGFYRTVHTYWESAYGEPDRFNSSAELDNYLHELIDETWKDYDKTLDHNQSVNTTRDYYKRLTE